MRLLIEPIEVLTNNYGHDEIIDQIPDRKNGEWTEQMIELPSVLYIFPILSVSLSPGCFRFSVFLLSNTKTTLHQCLKLFVSVLVCVLLTVVYNSAMPNEGSTSTITLSFNVC